MEDKLTRAAIGAGIGIIVGTFLIPGLGSVAGAKLGALMSGAGSDTPPIS